MKESYTWEHVYKLGAKTEMLPLREIKVVAVTFLLLLSFSNNAAHG